MVILNNAFIVPYTKVRDEYTCIIINVSTYWFSSRWI